MSKKYAKAKDAKKKEMLIEAILAQAEDDDDDEDEDDEEEEVQDLTKMDVDKLRSIAKQVGLKPAKGATKKQLIKLIEDAAEAEEE